MRKMGGGKRMEKERGWKRKERRNRIRKLRNKMDIGEKRRRRGQK
jgi:hypothetical protein